MSLKALIGETLRFDPERWALLEQDYKETREQLDPVVRNLPSGEKTAWIISSMNTPWGWKLDGVMSLAARLAGYKPFSAYHQQDLWGDRYHGLFKLPPLSIWHKSTRPAVAIVLEKSAPGIAEFCGQLIDCGIPLVQYLGTQHDNAFAFKRFNAQNYRMHPFSIDPSTRIEELTEDQENALMVEFMQSYADGSWFNRKFLHEAKRMYFPHVTRQKLGLDPSKKTAVIFAHVIGDATNYYGENLFKDYAEWLVETVKVARSMPQLNWIVKLHPDLTWKTKYKGHQYQSNERELLGELPPHIKLVPPDTDIDTYSFFGITDYCLTVRGTIGIEMACHGIPVLTAGTGRYDHCGFTIDSASASQYIHRLEGIDSIMPYDAYQTKRARAFAYTLFNRRPWHMKSFTIEKKPLKDTGHVFDQNIRCNIKSLNDAHDLKDLARYLQSNEIDYLRPAHRNV